MEVSCQLHALAILPAGTHWIEGLVVPASGLVMLAKRKILPLLAVES
jgi:hypothetical protein